MRTLQMSKEMWFLVCSSKNHYGNSTRVFGNVFMVMVCSSLNLKYYALHGTLGI